MNIYVFSKKGEKYATNRIITEGVRGNHDIKRLLYSNLQIKFENDETNLFYEGKLLDKPDAVVLRVSGRGLASPLFVYHRMGLINYLDSSFVLNRNTYLKWPRLNKLEQHYEMVKNGIPVIPTVTYASDGIVDWNNIEYPLIAKTIYGSSGKGVFKVDDEGEMKKAIEEFGANTLLLQKFLPTKQDYRVIVIGKKALPFMMKKTAQGDNFRTNYAQGGKVEGLSLTEELKILAEKTAEVFDSDYCGIDVMYDENNKPYVLEINRGAQFEGFELSTGYNVAEHIIKYLESVTGKS